MSAIACNITRLELPESNCCRAIIGRFDMSSKSQTTKDTGVTGIVKHRLNAWRVFDRRGLKGCVGEHAASEPSGFPSPPFLQSSISCTP